MVGYYWTNLSILPPLLVNIVLLFLLTSKNTSTPFSWERKKKKFLSLNFIKFSMRNCLSLRKIWEMQRVRELYWCYCGYLLYTSCLTCRPEEPSKGCLTCVQEFCEESWSVMENYVEKCAHTFSSHLYIDLSRNLSNAFADWVRVY